MALKYWSSCFTFHVWGLPVWTPDSCSIAARDVLHGTKPNFNQSFIPIPDFTDEALEPRKSTGLVQDCGFNSIKAGSFLQICCARGAHWSDHQHSKKLPYWLLFPGLLKSCSVHQAGWLLLFIMGLLACVGVCHEVANRDRSYLCSSNLSLAYCMRKSVFKFIKDMESP